MPQLGPFSDQIPGIISSSPVALSDSNGETSEELETLETPLLVQAQLKTNTRVLTFASTLHHYYTVQYPIDCIHLTLQ